MCICSKIKQNTGWIVNLWKHMEHCSIVRVVWSVLIFDVDNVFA